MPCGLDLLAEAADSKDASFEAATSSSSQSEPKGQDTKSDCSGEKASVVSMGTMRGTQQVGRWHLGQTSSRVKKQRAQSGAAPAEIPFLESTRLVPLRRPPVGTSTVAANSRFIQPLFGSASSSCNSSTPMLLDMLRCEG